MTLNSVTSAVINLKRRDKHVLIVEVNLRKKKRDQELGRIKLQANREQKEE